MFGEEVDERENVWWEDLWCFVDVVVSSFRSGMSAKGSSSSSEASSEMDVVWFLWWLSWSKRGGEEVVVVVDVRVRLGLWRREWAWGFWL